MERIVYQYRAIKSTDLVAGTIDAPVENNRPSVIVWQQYHGRKPIILFALKSRNRRITQESG